MILAIDPGVTGALAVFTDLADLHVVGDLPTITLRRTRRVDTRINARALADLLDTWPGTIVLEDVHAQGRNGSLANFSLGHTFGTIQAVCQLTRHEAVVLAPPQRWKRELGLDNDKKASLAMARERWGHEHFPLEKHHNRAEAALLGHWFLNVHTVKASD